MTGKQKCFLVKWAHNKIALKYYIGSLFARRYCACCFLLKQVTDICGPACVCVGSWLLWKRSSRLSLFLDGDVSTSSTGSTGGSGPGSGRSPRPRPAPGSRGSSRCSSCSCCSSAQYSGDFSLHEGPRGAVGRVIQRTALSAGAVHLSISPSALNVHSGAGEAEPAFGGFREDLLLQLSVRLIY